MIEDRRLMIANERSTIEKLNDFGCKPQSGIDGQQFV